MRVTIHITAEMDNEIWGVHELIDELVKGGGTDDEIEKAVLELADEDFGSLLDDAEYRVEIERD